MLAEGMLKLSKRQTDRPNPAILLPCPKGVVMGKLGEAIRESLREFGLRSASIYNLIICSSFSLDILSPSIGSSL